MQKSTVSTSAPLASPAPKRVRTPQVLLRPGDYRALRVYTGSNPGRSTSKLEELVYDDFKDADWDTIERQLRARHGKKDIHVKCIGGPKLAWFVPRNIRIADTDELTVGMEQIRSLSDKIAELEIENARLKAQLLQAPAVGDVDDDFEDYDDEDEDPPMLTQILGVIKEYGPTIKGLADAFIQQKQQQPPMQTAQEQAPAQHFADVEPETAAPASDIASPAGQDESDDYDIPTSILEYLDAIDWTRTSPKKLLGMAMMYEEKFEENGIYFKPD